MGLGKWMHRLGAVGVEVLAVLVLGWFLSMTNPSRTDLETVNGHPKDASAVEAVAQREIDPGYISGQLERAADGLMDQLVAHLSSLFDVGEEV